MRKRDIKKMAERGQEIVGNKPRDMSISEMAAFIGMLKEPDANNVCDIVTTAFYMGVAVGHSEATGSVTSRL